MDPLFSFVVPVFNTADYIDEAIGSLVGQTLDFARNIEIVIVDDGSCDASIDKCHAWQKRYPENILLIASEHVGVSAARNIGFRASRGKYINFFDSDDWWSEDWCAETKRFLEAHPDIQMVAAKHMYFGKRKEPHPLSWKYEKDAIVDLGGSPEYFHHSASNAFIARELIIPFEESLRYSEDFRFINEILLKIGRYGVLSAPTYWYRKRDEQTSALDTASLDSTYYTETPKSCYCHLLDTAKKTNRGVPRFLQLAIMYDLQWRLRSYDLARDVLTDGELAAYNEIMHDILSDIEDSVILGQSHLPLKLATAALASKHKITFEKAAASISVLSAKSVSVKNAQAMIAPNSLCELVVEFIEECCGRLSTEFKWDTPFPSSRVSLIVKFNDMVINAEALERVDLRTCLLGIDVPGAWGFRTQLPRGDGKAQVRVVIDGTEIPAILAPGKFCPIGFAYGSYAQLGNVLVSGDGEKSEMVVRRRSAVLEALLEIRFQRQLARASKGTFRHFIYRWYAFAHRCYPFEKEIWIISDRPTQARDNGEALFRYLSKYTDKKRKVYFVVRQDTPDYKRLSGIGNVLDFGSPECKKMMLRASVILSSQAEDYVFQPFPIDYMHMFRDTSRIPFVFLQHGIIMNDLSRWLKRWQKNIALFVTTNTREHEEILANPVYGYSSATVKQIGMARYDRLIELTTDSSDEQVLLVAPTWRKNLTTPLDMMTGLRKEKEGFGDSDYFRFFRNLLRNPRILSFAEENAWKIRFVLHPSLKQERQVFEDAGIEVVEDCDYASEIVNATLFVTDYSSLTFDAAFCRVPQVYCQFDKETFYASQIYSEGYFSYEDDGFGIVTTTLDETVEAVIALMQNPVIAPKYNQRIDACFGSSIVAAEPEIRCRNTVEAVEQLLSKRLNKQI